MVINRKRANINKNITKGLEKQYITDGKINTPTIRDAISPALKNEHGDERLTFRESLKTQPIIYIVWILSIIIVMVLYAWIIGFRNKLTIALGVFLLVILIINMFMSGLDSIDPYEIELALYDYVESNAQAFLPFGIALAALVIASHKKEEILRDKNFLFPLLLATACFVFVLTILWMPKDSGLPIRVWRDVKTAVLTLGGVTVVAMVGEFVMAHTSSSN